MCVRIFLFIERVCVHHITYNHAYMLTYILMVWCKVCIVPDCMYSIQTLVFSLCLSLSLCVYVCACDVCIYMYTYTNAINRNTDTQRRAYIEFHFNFSFPPHFVVHMDIFALSGRTSCRLMPWFLGCAFSSICVQCPLCSCWLALFNLPWVSIDKPSDPFHAIHSVPLTRVDTQTRTCEV